MIEQSQEQSLLFKAINLFKEKISHPAWVTDSIGFDRCPVCHTQYRHELEGVPDKLEYEKDHSTFTGLLAKTRRIGNRIETTCVDCRKNVFVTIEKEEQDISAKEGVEMNHIHKVTRQAGKLIHAEDDITSAVALRDLVEYLKNGYSIDLIELGKIVVHRSWRGGLPETITFFGRKSRMRPFVTLSYYLARANRRFRSEAVVMQLEEIQKQLLLADELPACIGNSREEIIIGSMLIACGMKEEDIQEFLSAGLEEVLQACEQTLDSGVEITTAFENVLVRRNKKA